MTAEPLIIIVAPNGARKTQADHPSLPILPEEIAQEARRCMDAGASMIHLHVRDQGQGHSLDVGRYRAAIEAIEDECNGGILIQATTEAVGMYTAAQQMQMVRELRPPSVSLAISELVPEDGEPAARDFFHDLQDLNILPHYILYSVEDVLRFEQLRDRGVIPHSPAFLLFVLGRYTAGQQSHPRDLIPFLNVMNRADIWSVCAFGPLEHMTASAAIAMGGHVRVGFENNMLLKDGKQALSNAELVCQVSQVSDAIGRPVAGVSELKKSVIICS